MILEDSLKARFQLKSLMESSRSTPVGSSVPTDQVKIENLPRSLTQVQVNEIIYEIDLLVEAASKAEPPVPAQLVKSIRIAVFRGLRDKRISPAQYPEFKQRLIDNYRYLLLEPETSPEPRKLSESEIESILREVASAAPYATPSPIVHETMMEIMKKLLRYQLMQIRITPLGIEQLTAKLIRYYIKSLVTYGTNVGGYAADAFSVHATQGALDSFHRSGSAKNITSGVKAIQELLDASENRGSPASTLSFASPVTFEQALTDKVADIVQLLVIDPKSFQERLPGQSEPDPNNLKNNGIALPYMGLDKITVLQFRESGVEPWWYETYRSLVNPSFPRQTQGDVNDVRYIPYVGLSRHACRLAINLSKVHLHRVVMSKICNAIESGSKSGTLICLPSPILRNQVTDATNDREAEYASVAFIDIFVNENRVHGEDIMKGRLPDLIASQKGLFFLQNSVIPSLPGVLIKGIRGIEELYPVRNSTTAAVLDQLYQGMERIPWEQASKMVPPSNDIPPGAVPLLPNQEGAPYPILRWRFRLNHRIMNKKGINVSDLVSLLHYVGARYFSPHEDEDESWIDFSLPVLHRPSDFEEVMNLKKEPDASKWMTIAEYDSLQEYPEIGNNFMAPLDYLNYLIRKATDQVREQRDENKERRNELIRAGRSREARSIRIVPPAPTLLNRSEFILVDTDGENMKDVYNLSDIDPDSTYGNNLHEILSTFGVEALRTYLIEELDVATGGSFDIRHIEIVVDYMLRMGFITGFTKGSYVRQRQGPFPEMLLNSRKALFEATAFSMTYDTKPLSAAVVTGQRTRVGTGMVDVRVDRASYAEEEARLRYQIESGQLTTMEAEELEEEFWAQTLTTVYAYEKPSGEYASEFGANLDMGESVILAEQNVASVVPSMPYRVRPEETIEVMNRLDASAPYLDSIAEEDSIVMDAFTPGESTVISYNDQFSYNELEENTQFEYPTFDEEDIF